MKAYILLMSLSLADIAALSLIVGMGVGTFCVMWFEYKRYLEEHIGKRFRLADFIKKEQLYIFLFLVLLFLICGEWLLYWEM